MVQEGVLLPTIHLLALSLLLHHPQNYHHPHFVRQGMELLPPDQHPTRRREERPKIRQKRQKRE
jgi:hypothetical protein